MPSFGSPPERATQGLGWVAPPWALLTGAWLGVPLAVAGFAALATTGQSCLDSGVGGLVLAVIVAVMLGCGWALYCGARRWWLCGAIVSASVLGSMAGAATWAWVGFDRCFTF